MKVEYEMYVPFIKEKHPGAWEKYVPFCMNEYKNHSKVVERMFVFDI